MICKLHVKASLVILFLILGVVGCNQGQEWPSEPQSTTEPQTAAELPSLSIPMKAGLYQVNVTKISPVTPDPVKVSKKQCFSEASFDPFRSIHLNEMCNITNINKGADKVSFDLDCNDTKGNQAAGSAEYSAVGDKLNWSLKLDGIDNEVTKTGEYVGECE